MAPNRPVPSAAIVQRLRERYGDPYLEKSIDIVFQVPTKPAAKPAMPVTEPPAAVAAAVPTPPPAPAVSNPAAPSAAPPAAPPVEPPVEPPAAPAPKELPKAPPELVLVSAAAKAYASTKPNTSSSEFKAAQAEVDETLKKFAPLDLRTLPVAVQRALAWMRKACDDEIARDPRLKPSAEMGHDLRLFRFLVGQKWDAQKGVSEYVAALKKRRELKIDSLRDAMVAANTSFFTQGGATLDKVSFHASTEAVNKAMPRLWYDPRGDAPYSLLLHKDGHLMVSEYAPDFDKIGEVGAQNWHGVEVAFTELQMLVLDELSKRAGVLKMQCKVSDVKDREGSLSKSLMPNPFAGKAEKQFKETGALMKSLYPTVLYKWVFVNLRPSWKSNLQTAINNFGGRSKHKMMICDSNFEQTVLAEADAAVLPVQLCGSLPVWTFKQS